ncbi:transcriptional regulator, AraC family [Pseudoxanthobacter soli DSM 19599]|uniref:Transcriptional regulator, AraC family n=1 Tax=Pseudoxanthobacter soli DSM 19599 TaxID=1123029 RepID=A0A1M7ZMJ9_9HYPH|nr:AraC family transcriptional regulator [Pseudoxanthobacter soli]SHO66039.1 transcriptional regulator, AraC family [Pseudoxanthobacter soli DSM 19599]
MTIVRSETTVEDPMIALARDRIAEIVKRHLSTNGRPETAVAGLTIHGKTGPAEPASFFYDPSFALIARGSKRVVLGGESYVYDESHFLMTAVGLPTIVQVLNASESQPYYSIKLSIDLDLARELISELAQYGAKAPVASMGMAIGPVTPSLALAAMRLTELLDRPQDIPALARSLQREILYHVLISPIGDRLRQAVQLDARTSRVATAIQWIRGNFAEALRIEELAAMAGMGESTLHHHFRAITAMSPLQYQKHLRLHEARRLMVNDRIDAGLAAFKVGYESSTQFNREYSRLFGAPPKRDVTAILSNDVAVRQRATPSL